MSHKLQWQSPLSKLQLWRTKILVQTHMMVLNSLAPMRKFYPLTVVLFVLSLCLYFGAPCFMASFCFSILGSQYSLTCALKACIHLPVVSDNFECSVKSIPLWLCYWHSYMNMAECPVCSRYILSHSKVVTSGICKYVFHLKCVPLNTQEQYCITTQKQSWYCTSCITEIFTFNFIENDKLFPAEINNYDLKSRVIELSDALF